MKVAQPESDAALIAELKARAFDAAAIFTVYSQSPLPAAYLCYLAGIPLRLAHCRENPYHLLTDWVPEPEPAARMRHEVQRQLDLVATVGCTHRRRAAVVSRCRRGRTQRVRRLMAHRSRAAAGRGAPRRHRRLAPLSAGPVRAGGRAPRPRAPAAPSSSPATRTSEALVQSVREAMTRPRLRSRARSSSASWPR